MVKAGAVATATSTSITPAFGQSTTAGNLLIGFVHSQTSGTWSTTSTGWALAEGSASSTDGVAGIFYKANCGAGEAAPTFTTTSTTLHAILVEYSGAATTSPLDQKNTAANSSTVITVTNGSVDATAGNLVVSSSSWLYSTTTTRTMVNTFNNGATSTALGTNSGASAAFFYQFDYGINTGNSTADVQTNTASTASHLTGGHAVLASFKNSVNNFTSTQTGTMSFTGPTHPENSINSHYTGVLSMTGAALKNAITSGLAAASIRFMGILNRAIGKTISPASLSLIGSAQNFINKVMNGAITFTGIANLTNSVTHGVSATLSFAGSQLRAISTGIAGATLSLAGTTTNLTSHIISASLSFVGAIVSQKAIGKVLSGALSFTGPTNLTNVVSNVLAATLSFTGALQRAMSTGLSASLSFMGGIIKFTVHLLKRFIILG